MLHKIISIILVTVIILFVIGLRGVYVDVFLTEVEKKDFLLKYLIIILGTILLLFLNIWIEYKRKQG